MLSTEKAELQTKISTLEKSVLDLTASQEEYKDRITREAQRTEMLSLMIQTSKKDLETYQVAEKQLKDTIQQA